MIIQATEILNFIDFSKYDEGLVIDSEHKYKGLDLFIEIDTRATHGIVQVSLFNQGDVEPFEISGCLETLIWDQIESGKLEAKNLTEHYNSLSQTI